MYDFHRDSQSPVLTTDGTTACHVFDDGVFAPHQVKEAQQFHDAQSDLLMLHCVPQTKLGCVIQRLLVRQTFHVRWELRPSSRRTISKTHPNTKRPRLSRHVTSNRIT